MAAAAAAAGSGRSQEEVDEEVGGAATTATPRPAAPAAAGSTHPDDPDHLSTVFKLLPPAALLAATGAGPFGCCCMLLAGQQQLARLLLPPLPRGAAWRLARCVVGGCRPPAHEDGFHHSPSLLLPRRPSEGHQKVRVQVFFCCTTPTTTQCLYPHRRGRLLPGWSRDDLLCCPQPAEDKALIL